MKNSPVLLQAQNSPMKAEEKTLSGMFLNNQELI